MNKIANTPITLEEIKGLEDIGKFYRDQYQKMEDLFEEVKSENTLFSQVLHDLLTLLQPENSK